MILPEDIRIKIADRMVRIVAPVVIIAMSITALGLMIIGGQQYHRLIPTLIALIAMIPAWYLAVKGKPFDSIIIMLACLCVAILAGMVFSGGIRSPAYMAGISCITVFIVLFGMRGGVIFGISALLLGALFILLHAKGILPKADEPTAVFLLLLHGIFLFMQLCFVLVPVHLMFKSLKETQSQSLKLKEVIGEKQQAQKELQSIINKTPDIIYRLDTTGKITFMSAAVKRYGLSPKGFIGNPLLEYVHPDDRDAVSRSLLERRSGERGSQDVEVRFLDGKKQAGSTLEQNAGENWQTFLISSDALYSDEDSTGGSYLGVQGVARDITERKVSENQLIRFATLIEQMDEEVVITDPDGIIQYVNPSFEKKMGYSQSEVAGLKPSVLKSGLHDIIFYKDLWATILAKKIWSGTIQNKCKDGKIIIHDMTVTPILNVKGSISAFVSIRRDITEKIRIEQQVQQAQKMEAIGSLAGGIAHDFNNILAGIMGYSELVRKDLENHGVPEATRQKMDRVIDASLRARDLVAQILAFSRSKGEEHSAVNVRLMAKEVLQLLRAILPSFIHIKENVFSSTRVMANPTSIHQILMNLCTNAGDAMAETGGTLTLELEDLQLDTDAVDEYDGVSPGWFLCVRVSDTGHGMTPSVLKNIMEPFFTTKPPGKGTGMGLSVVHNIVKALQGFVRVESQSGKGSQFEVFLPACAENAPRSALDTRDKKADYTGSEKILFVDDEKVLAEMAKDIIENYGYEVKIFSDSKAALEHFKNNSEKYDMLISDITMPEMTGDVLAREVRLIRDEIPVVLCTGFSEKINNQGPNELNINAFLNKPVPGELLLSTIRSVFDTDLRNKKATTSLK